MKLALAIATVTAIMGGPSAVFASATSNSNNNLRFPSNHHRELANYAKCEGSCSFDNDCSGSLLCLVDYDKRYNNFFPGCSGEPPRNTNWCYNPNDFSNKLFFIGNEGKPKNVFPLDKCRGDCDTDDDCKGDLKCFERYDETSVPGCTGITATDGVDYCYDPNDNNRQSGGPEVFDTLKNVGNPPNKVLQNCEGDCDYDTDCADKLLCFQRDGSEDDSIPGCKGVAENDVDYCYDPLAKKRVGGGPEKPTLERIFFDKCQGDCDDDGDCKGNLRCYQNHKYGEHPVPGCSGLVKDSTDYCYDPADN